MWNLHVGPIFLLKCSARLLYFLSFLQKIVSKLYAEYFVQYFLQILSFFIFWFFTNSVMFYKFEYICTSVRNMAILVHYL